jgi:hypothetical protein
LIVRCVTGVIPLTCCAINRGRTPVSSHETCAAPVAHRERNAPAADAAITVEVSDSTPRQAQHAFGDDVALDL